MIGPELHLASAGGGSAGFGGGGGGFHGGGGGKGFAIYLILQFLVRIALIGHGIGAAVLVVVVLLWFLFARVLPGRMSSRQESGPAARRRTQKRERRVELAAAEASDDDPIFAPETVRSQATALFTDIQAAWDQGDRARLGALLAPPLFAEWMRRLDDFGRRGWRNRVRVLGTPRVEYVSLKHRGTPDQDRVVVRVEAKMSDYVEDQYGNRLKRAGRLSETVRVREYWTLARHRDRWILASIEQGGEGLHALDEEVVAMPWSDDQKMRDEALIEGAVDEAVPEGTSVADVADLHFEGSAHAAALDLSVADGRFSPDVLEVSARRAVQAWADAIDGNDEELYSVAKGQVIRDLLHPGDPSGSTRLVVRGPQVKRIRISGLDAAAQPPTMTVDVDIVGRRYIEDRDTTAVLSGSKTRPTGFTEHWTLALDDDRDQLWKIVAVSTPLAPA